MNKLPSKHYRFFIFTIIFTFFQIQCIANPPYPPVNLEMQYNKLTHEVLLSWGQPLTIPDGYRIYRDHELIATVPTTGSTTEYSYTTKLPGYGVYAFYVRAYNADGESNVKIHRSVAWVDADGSTDTLRQWGISWMFDKDVEFGQFANGDYWIIGPVNIVAINPAIDTVNGDVIHGSMLDPNIKEGGTYDAKQGYDERQRNYSDKLNVALGISEQDPLTVPAGHSLVSVRSYYPDENDRRILRTAAVLTVLDAAPPEGSFRPSYSSTDKSILYNIDDLDYSFLQNLENPYDDLNVKDVESEIEKVFLDNSGSDFDMESNISPVENMDDYGRRVCNTFESVILALNLDITQEEKEKLMIYFTQIGIDLFGVVQTCETIGWNGWGGHFLGRKLPILFAGMALDSETLKNVEDNYPDIHYGENDIFYYYDDTRLPEDAINKYSWTGSKVLYKFNYHWDDPKYSQIYDHKHPSEWTKGNDEVPYITDDLSETYRTCCTAKYMAGIALAVRLMGFTEVWGNDAFFSYIDRWMCEDMTHFIPVINKETGSERVPRDYANAGNFFSAAMWKAYRNIDDTTPPTIPANVTISAKNDTVKIKWGRCGDDIGGVGYYIYFNENVIDTVYGFEEWAGVSMGDNASYQLSAFDWAGNETLLVSPVSTGIKENMDVDDKIFIYPNPTSGKINLSFHKTFNVEVLNMLGEEVLETKNKVIDISANPDGIYLLRIKSGNNIIIKRIILDKL